MSSKEVPRRAFLGFASAAATLAACARPGAATPKVAAPRVTAAAPGEERWAAIREQFPLPRDRAHFASFFLASNPRPVREAIDAFQRRLDEDPVGVVEHDFETGEFTNATLDAAAKYLGVSRYEIALTDSTTTALGIMYSGLVLEKGDEIITTKHDHWVTHEALRFAADRSGASWRQVALYEKAARANVDGMVRAIVSAITPATKVVAATWVHSSTGVKIPVRAIADAIAKANASRAADDRILFCIDGVHGFGIENATLPDLGCDFFAAGCHKWLFGPRGTGLLWGRADAWPRLRPTACPFYFPYIMARLQGTELPKQDARVMTPGGFRAFEHRWALAEAFKFHMQIGKADVEKRIHELAMRCRKGLAAMKHVTLHTPVDERLASGIVCFEVAGMTPQAVVKRMAEQGIVGSTTPYVPSYARLSPALVNTPDEVDRALEAIRKMG